MRASATVGHLVEERFLYLVVWGRLTQRFATTTVRFDPPEEDVAIVDLRCSECDAELMLEVMSAARLRRVQRRRLWTVAGALGVSLATAAVGLVTEYAGHPIPLETAAGAAWIVAFVLGLAVAGIAGYTWRHERGMSLHAVDLDESGGLHRLMDDPIPGFPVD